MSCTHNKQNQVNGVGSAKLDACRRLLPGFADVVQVLAMAPMTKTGLPNCS